MSLSVKNPTYLEVKKWGALSYLTESEREKIMVMPAGEAKRKIKSLEREILDMKKKQRSKG